MNAALSSTSSTKIGLGALLRAAITGGVIAAVANMAVYGIGRAVGVDFIGRFDPAQAPTPLMPFLPAVASLIPAVLAGFVALGFARMLKRPAMPFAVLAVVFGVVSMAGPMGLADASTGTKVVLSLMHVVAGVPITVWILRALGK